MSKVIIQKKDIVGKYAKFYASLMSIIITLVIFGIIIWFYKGNFSYVLEAFKEIFTWPFLFGLGIEDTINKMVPILIAGLGLIIAFRMKLWNIGAEGQIFVGAIITTGVSLYVIKNPSPYQIFFILLLGSLAGAIWGAIPGFLKAFFNIDEIVTTLMLNYIAIYLVNYLIYGPWKDPNGFNFPLTKIFDNKLWLKTFGNSYVHSGIFIAIILAIVIFFILKKTRWGFNIKIIGDNYKAAKYSGISVKKNIILVMFLSGAFAGLAGSIQMLGVQHRLQNGFCPGYGYTAIIVAWLSGLNPIAIIPVSFLFAGMLVGSEQLQIVMNLPISMVSILQGLILFTLLATEALMGYKISFTKVGERNGSC